MTLSLMMLAYTACSDYVDAVDENRTMLNSNYRNITQGQPDRNNQQFHPSNNLYYQQIQICTADHAVYRGTETDLRRGDSSVEGFFQSIWRGLTGSTEEYPANFYPGQTANLEQRSQEQYGVELAHYSNTHTSYFPQPQPSGSVSAVLSQAQDPLARSYQSQGQSVDIRNYQQQR